MHVHVYWFNYVFRCDRAREMLLSTPDLKKKWSYSVEWLHDELDRVSAAHSALRLRKCSLINRKLFRTASVWRQQSIFLQQLVAPGALERNVERLLPGALTLGPPNSFASHGAVPRRRTTREMHTVLSFDLNGTLLLLFYLYCAGVGGSGGRSGAAERSERGRESLAPHAAAQLAATAGRR